MEIKIKRLSPNAVIPTQGHNGDAGYDLYACDIHGGKIEIPPHGTCKIGTGIALAIPMGYAGLVFLRSGLSTKRGLRPANCVGLTLRTEAKFSFQHTTIPPFRRPLKMVKELHSWLSRRLLRLISTKSMSSTKLTAEPVDSALLA